MIFKQLDWHRIQRKRFRAQGFYNMMSHSRADLTKLGKSYLTSFFDNHKGTGCSFRDSVQLSSKAVDSLDEKVVDILSNFQSATGKAWDKTMVISQENVSPGDRLQLSPLTNA